MKARKFFTGILCYCIFTISLFGQAVNFITTEKADFSVSFTLADSFRRDLRTEPVMFEKYFSADFKELKADCGLAMQDSKIDFTSGVTYLPTFFGWFRGGLGFRQHLYRYINTFTENDLFFSACLEWCKTDFFNAELAGGLWKEDIRECRMIAAMIYPEDRFLPDLADVWIEQIEYPDLAEVCCMYLFCRMQGASEAAFRWIASDNGMARYCGFLTLAHLLRGGREMSERYVQELKDQAEAAIKGSDLMSAQAARTALDCLERDNG